MKQAYHVLFGLGLILFGLAFLSMNLILPALGIHLGIFEAWRYWPLIILGVGSLLSLLALMSIGQRGWAALFIPAAPINVTGLILLYASVFNQWQVWEFAWSFIVLSVAAGFLLAAIFGRNAWLGIPAILVGVNGLVLAFCSLTGLWSWWSVLWTVEPLAIGLVLLLIAYKTRSTSLSVIGVTVCAASLMAAGAMSGFVLFGGWMLRLGAPALLIMLGVLLLGWGLVRRPAAL